MTRPRPFLPLALLLVLLLPPPFVSFAAPAADPRPNFLVILCDDLGWGDLAGYGHPRIETPHLDRLAREGMRLTDCYSAAPVCSPSRVGLLTGRDPARAGVFDWIPDIAQPGARDLNRAAVHLRREEVTLPALLQQAGYATALSGKWHANSRFNHPAQPQPSDAGFQFWFATQNNAAPSHENPVNFVRNGEAVGPLTGYSCRLVAREATDWLRRQRDEAPGTPTFLFVAFHEPHEPVASPPELVAKYRTLSRNENEAQYFANIANLDAAVGDLMAALEELQLEHNTLVFFSSDNGPETLDRYPTAKRSYGTPGPLRGMKLWTTEAGVRVPGIIRWPAAVAPGRVESQPVSSLDLLPTFAALAGVEPPAGLRLDGTDIRPLLRGGDWTRDRPIAWVYFNALNEQRVALRDGPWKLLARLDGGELPRLTNITETNRARVVAARLTDFSLFHLPSDPGESSDRAAAEPEKLAELAAKLESWHHDLTTTMHVWSAP